jgi:nitrogen regulatory protein P-II 1
MKVIVAFIRPAKEEAVREALHELPGLTGASFSDVRGFGRGRSHVGDEDILGAAPRVRVEVMANDLLADRVESTIASVAHTGKRGDGKVFVLPLSAAHRISTGETGADGI